MHFTGKNSSMLGAIVYASFADWVTVIIVRKLCCNASEGVVGGGGGRRAIFVHRQVISILNQMGRHRVDVEK